jgi:iron(III) transport system substrate-binding protein
MDKRQRCLFSLGVFAILVIAGQGMAIAQDGQSFAFAQIAQAADSASAKSANASANAIVDAARKEGQLSIVVGEGSFGGSNSDLAQAFNKYYGLNLNVRFTPGPAMPNMVATAIQQFQSGRPATTDVLTGYANHVLALIDAGAALKVDWADWAPNLQRPELSSADGAAVPIMSSTPGIAYNTTVFQGDDIPKTFHDLLNPKLKGRVATTPYGSSFDRLATKELWGKEKAFEFAHQLSAQVGGLIRCNEAERLASGEFDVFGLTCSQSNALRPASKGAPIGFVLASDAPIIMPLYEAIPATSAHPNAAKLWINFLLSEDAQKMLFKLDFQDLHLLEGSKTGESINKLKAQGVRFLVADIDFYRSHNAAEMDQDVTKVQEILRTK